MSWQVPSIAAVVVLAVWSLGWWLRGQFQQVRDASDIRWAAIKDTFDRRHEENIKQFGRIYVALAQLGWRNGDPHPPARED